jgi:hypothetical protein
MVTEGCPWSDLRAWAAGRREIAGQLSLFEFVQEGEKRYRQQPIAQG